MFVVPFFLKRRKMIRYDLCFKSIMLVAMSKKTKLAKKEAIVMSAVVPKQAVTVTWGRV